MLHILVESERVIANIVLFVNLFHVASDAKTVNNAKLSDSVDPSWLRVARVLDKKGDVSHVVRGPTIRVDLEAPHGEPILERDGKLVAVQGFCVGKRLGNCLKFVNGPEVVEDNVLGDCGVAEVVTADRRRKDFRVCSRCRSATKGVLCRYTK